MKYMGNEVSAKIEAVIGCIGLLVMGNHKLAASIIAVTTLIMPGFSFAAEAKKPVGTEGCKPAIQTGVEQKLDLRETVLNLVGPAIPPQEASILGAPFERYEKDFRNFSERHWKADGSRWEEANYYDRSRIFYVGWARTGDASFLERAHELALDYRRNYIEANGFKPTAHWSQLTGLALHCLITGDVQSGEAVGRVADFFSTPNYIKTLSDLRGEMDNRIQARTLEAFLLAWQIGAPSLGISDIQTDGSDWGIPGGNDWAKLLRAALGRILASQSPDGAYRFQQVQCGQNKPFMVGMLNDALIQYYDHFEEDPRILPAIKKSLDYLWEKNWNAKAQAFVYLEGPCEDNDMGPAPDLNNLILNGFGWVYRQTGDVTYRTRGDSVLEGAVKGAWLAGSKQFNQTYTTSYKYAAFRRQSDAKR